MTMVHNALELGDHPILWTALGRSRFLRPEEQRALEDAADPPRTLGANKELIREGERNHGLFLITKGWAYRYALTRAGNRQIIALLVPGDVCNLDALLFDQLDYGVRTLTEMTIISITTERAIALAAQHTGIARTFLWLALVQNATLGKWAVGLGRRSAIERLGHLICELGERLDITRSEYGVTFDFPLTQEQIGDTLGLTAVHVNRTLQRLRTDGLISVSGRTMTILNARQLHLVADFNGRYLHTDEPRSHRI